MVCGLWIVDCEVLILLAFMWIIREQKSCVAEELVVAMMILW